MSGLTIGMPLFNNESTLRRAVDSLLTQTEPDFVLMMSDDVSSDSTVAIAQEFVAADRRVQLVRQPTNLNYGNFRFLLHQASTPFFMFASGDDWWEPTFVERCLHAIEDDSEVVCAVARVEFFGDHLAPPPFVGTRPIAGTAHERLADFLSDPGDNSRMYGIFRTDAAKAAFPRSDHYAFDWTFSAATLLHGEHVEIPEVLIHREITPQSRYIEYVRRDNPRIVDRLFPLLPMTRALIFDKRIPLRLSVIKVLASSNLWMHVLYARRYHPRYAQVASRIERALF